MNDIRAALGQNRRIVLEAPAGRGKTTTLVQLASDVQAGQIPIFIDLPGWVASGRGILEFISGTPQFQARGLDAGALARAQNAEQLWFLLNGWNEIAESNSERAEQALRDLDLHFPRAGIVVATRTHHLVPPLPGAVRLRLLPLLRRERAAYLAARLGAKAPELQALLDAEPVLDELTRTPFILSEVASLFEAGVPIPDTKIGVLGAVIELQERGEHRNALQAAPLFGRAGDYGNSSGVYTQRARQSNELRTALFQMANGDVKRRIQAFELFAQIEEWRLQRGRPAGEPRHPDFQSGFPWPPIEPV